MLSRDLEYMLTKTIRTSRRYTMKTEVKVDLRSKSYISIWRKSINNYPFKLNS